MAEGDGNYYIELCKNPIRFDPVDKVTNVFYDDANKQVGSLDAVLTLILLCIIYCFYSNVCIVWVSKSCISLWVFSSVFKIISTCSHWHTFQMYCCICNTAHSLCIFSLFKVPFPLYKHLYCCFFLIIIVTCTMYSHCLPFYSQSNA